MVSKIPAYDNITPVDISIKLRILENINRAKIFKWCLEKEYSISELQRKLGISYKAVWTHVRELERTALIKTREVINKKGKNVYVKTVAGPSLIIEIDLMKIIDQRLKAEKVANAYLKNTP